MQKKTLFILFAVLFLGVVGLLFFLLKSSSIQSKSYYQENKTAKEISSDTLFHKKSWAKKLSTYKKNDYLFPVTELFLKMKFAKQKSVVIKKKEKYYSLVIPDLNNYSLFCILQVFNRKKVPYIIEDGYENSRIYVKTDKKSNLEELSAELKKYDIIPIIQNR